MQSDRVLALWPCLPGGGGGGRQAGTCPQLSFNASPAHETQPQASFKGRSQERPHGQARRNRAPQSTVPQFWKCLTVIPGRCQRSTGTCAAKRLVPRDLGPKYPNDLKLVTTPVAQEVRPRT